MMRLGASIRPLPQPLLLSTDLLIPRDHQLGVALGGEYVKPLWNGASASLRTGYRSDSDVSGFKGVSTGAGLDMGRVSFDFAWVPFGDLGNSYRYSLHVKFGPVPAPGDNDSKDHTVIQKTELYRDLPLNLDSL